VDVNRGRRETVVTRQRRTKVTTLSEAVDRISEGSCLALGGVLHVNRPAAAVREIARRRIGDLTLTSSPGSGWDADLLIGLGLVSRAILPMVTFGEIGMAPSFRHAVESGQLDAPYFDAMSQVAAYLAASYGHPYHFISSLDSTDIVRDNDLFDAVIDTAGQEHRVVKSLVPDVCILHVEEVDPYGNVRHLKGRVADPLMAMASRSTIVFADRIVAPEQVLMEPARTTISGQWVDAVVEVPYGAHPAATATYREDEEHLRAYHRAAEARRKGDSSEFDAYVAQFVDDPTDHDDYLSAVSTSADLEHLHWT
jgi:glutaconate CoA-transferase, subunit A